jgi:hypothetical protein
METTMEALAIFESILWASGLVCVLIYMELLREAFKVIEGDWRLWQQSKWAACYAPRKIGTRARIYPAKPPPGQAQRRLGTLIARDPA